MASLITGSDNKLIEFYDAFFTMLGADADIAPGIPDGLKKAAAERSIDHVFVIISNQEDFMNLQKYRTMLNEDKQTLYAVLSDEELSKMFRKRDLDILTHKQIVGHFANYLSSAGVCEPYFTKKKDVKSKATVLQYIKEVLSSGNVRLPVQNNVSIKLIPLLESDEVTFKQMADMTKLDPSLHAGIIKMANSVYYAGAFGEIVEVEKALVRVGTANLKVYILNYLNKSLMSNKNMIYYKEIAEAVNDSLIVAATCYALAEVYQVANASHSFSIGMLYKIGLIFMLAVLSDYLSDEKLDDESKKIYAEMASDNQIVAAVSLMKRWKFPKAFYEPIQNYKSMEKNGHTNETRILHFADFIKDYIANGGEPPNTETPLNRSEIKMSAKQLTAVKEKTLVHLEQIRSIINA